MPLNIRSKVLVVDDLESNLLIVEAILEDLDIQLFLASSGEEALRMVAVHRFAAILMDVQMPHMNGIEATKLIHSRPSSSDVPIIMFTANDSDDETLMAAYDAGAIDYVIKPVTPIILVNKIDQLVKQEKQRILVDQANELMLETNSRMSVLLNSAGEGILGIDIEGIITFSNPKACEILQIATGMLINQHVGNFLTCTNDDNSNWKETTLFKNIEGGVSSKCDSQQWKRSDGQFFDIQYSCEPMTETAEHLAGSVVMFQDISERKSVEANLRYLATYDQLTNLTNRAYFHDNLHKAIARSQRAKTHLGVLMLDLDHFKVVNDTYGHDGGDRLLQVVSARLKESIRVGDVVARMGGDEFAIILYDINDVEGATIVAQKIINRVSEDIDLSVAVVNVGCSIGITFYEDYSQDMEDTMKHADTALFEAKEQGRNNYKVFVPDMRLDMIEKKRIQNLLQDAVSNNELSLLYQPKVCLSKEKISGFEALLRWLPKDNDEILPASFIPVAEESGLITEIGFWVLEQVCAQLEAWNEESYQGAAISINVSSRQLKSSSYYERMVELFDQYSVVPESLELEITEIPGSEGRGRQSQNLVIKELEKINKLGVKIAYDECGAGNVTLDYLQRLPLNSVKIDRHLVEQVFDSPRDKEIIQMILAISTVMKLDVVVVGAESVEQLKFLSEHDCDFIQGYYFCKPVSASEASDLMLEFQHSKHVFAEKFEQINRP